MANKKFIVKLSGEERAQLTGLISKGKAAAKTLLKARILLKGDQGEAGGGWLDREICEALDTIVSVVARVRETFVNQGLDAVLTRKQRETPPVAPIFDGAAQAQLIALACSEAPEGYAHWTIRLLAEHAAMEDMLEVYTRPHDPAQPLVCLDETSKQLVAETRTPIPMQPGQPARCDYEYERNNTASLFMLFAPIEGWRHVKVMEQRTAVDYAPVLKELSDIHFAKAEKIVLVQDNLNTHTPASLYEAFQPEEARRLVERFEWHYTPKHGSWLDMAESGAGDPVRPMPGPPHPQSDHARTRGLGLA